MFLRQPKLQADLQPFNILTIQLHVVCVTLFNRAHGFPWRMLPNSATRLKIPWPRKTVGIAVQQISIPLG